MIKIKVCGIKDVKTARDALEYGADSLGFNFCSESPRYISPGKAQAIINELKGKIHTVGLFNTKDVSSIHSIVNETLVDIIQLNDPQYHEFSAPFSGPVVKAVRTKDPSKLKTMVDYHVHYDVLGKDPNTFSWHYSIEASKFGMIILSGGITKDTITKAIDEVKPYGIDLSEIIENPDSSIDSNLMREIIETIRKHS
jgi:phosphoribosylanthranilate isomerase